ncbi:MAG: rod shape-determining protein MreD [Muribaculaceae bacterium]|nr:rod shape-determining protein MreD [Muribaculaceae bacterium]
MAKTAFYLVVLTLVLLLAQVVVFNHMCLFNVAVPMVFIFALIKMPVSINVNWLMTIGFFMGLFVDVFADTYGMNSLSMTLLSVLRRPVMSLYLPRGEELPDDTMPSIKVFGVGTFVKYITTLTLLFCTIVFVIEAFSLLNFWLLIARIIFSTVLSVVIMLAIESLFKGQSEKRL